MTNQVDRREMNAPIREPLAVELLTSAHNRRSLDAELDEHLQADRGDFNPPSRRKDSELNRVLSLLDSLEEKGGLK